MSPASVHTTGEVGLDSLEFFRRKRGKAGIRNQFDTMDTPVSLYLFGWQLNGGHEV